MDSPGPMLVQIVCNELVLSRKASILDKQDQIVALIEEKRVTPIRMLYELFGKVGLVNDLKELWSNSVKTLGFNVVKDACLLKSHITIILELLTLKNDLDRFAAEAFVFNSDFTNIVKYAFEFFLNASPETATHIAVSLAKFISNAITQQPPESAASFGISSLAERQLVCCKALELFRLLRSNQTFEEAYRVELARRCLTKKSEGEGMEQYMFDQLKQECGVYFTSRMEGLYSDICNSENLNKEFANKHYFDIRISKNSNEASKYDKENEQSYIKTNIIEFDVSVCSKQAWPLSTEAYNATKNITRKTNEKKLENFDETSYPDIIYPPIIKSHYYLYTELYRKTFAARTLTWLPEFGCAILLFRCPAKSYELAVSQMQAVSLLRFDEQDQITVEELAAQTALTEETIRRELTPLHTDPNSSLLTYHQVSPAQISGSDKYELKVDFESSFDRLVISQIKMPSATGETSPTEVSEGHGDSTYQVDAAIVRNLKSEQKMRVEALHYAVNRVVRCSLTFLKERLETLVSRDFAERDSKEPDFYCYTP